MSKSILLLAVSVFLFSFANAQSRKEFTHSAETYIEELSDFMSDSKKREGKDLVEDEFEPIFLSGAFSAEDYEAVFTLSDRMLEERHSAYPEFENLIHSLMAISQRENFSQKLKEWSGFLIEMMEDRRADRFVTDVLANSRALFEEDIFFQSRAVKWKSSSKDYRFVIDSLPKIEIENHMITCYSKGDSLRVFNTSGFYAPTEEKWYGTNGKVT